MPTTTATPATEDPTNYGTMAMYGVVILVVAITVILAVKFIYNKSSSTRRRQQKIESTLERWKRKEDEPIYRFVCFALTSYSAF